MRKFLGILSGVYLFVSLSACNSGAGTAGVYLPAGTYTANIALAKNGQCANNNTLWG